MRNTAKKGEVVPFKHKEKTIDEIVVDGTKLKLRPPRPQSAIELQRRWLHRIKWIFIAIVFVALLVIVGRELQSIFAAKGQYVPLRRWF